VEEATLMEDKTITKDCQPLPSEEEKDTPILKIPSRVKIPDIPLDCQKGSHAIKYYQKLLDEAKAGVDMIPVHKDDLVLVGKYLVWWDTEHYWEIILREEMRGYSLYLHELFELDWYFRQDADPFNFQEQTAGFREAHAEALLHEHRFLQKVARTMGYSFSLKEIIIYNPHGDPPKDDWEGDWEVVRKHRKLSREDRHMNSDGEKKAREFYKRLDFQEV